MISLKELNPKNFKTTPEIDDNLTQLLTKINIIRTAYAKPMTVSSGLRDLEDHKRIYASKGIPDDKIPMGSRHLKGQAVDIADPNGKLYKWCKSNEAVLIQAGLYCEEGTKGWVHFQTVPPKSGKRWFLP